MLELEEKGSIVCDYESPTTVEDKTDEQGVIVRRVTYRRGSEPIVVWMKQLEEDCSVSDLESDGEEQNETEEEQEGISYYRTELANVRRWSIRAVATIYSGLRCTIERVNALD